MSAVLRLEAFSSKDEVKPVSLFSYELHSMKIDDKYKIIRGAVGKIKNYCHSYYYGICR